MYRQVREIITKEVIRGHLRNWLTAACWSKKNKEWDYYFNFDMETMMVEKGELVFTKTYLVTGEKSKTIIFFIDNIMRVYLMQHKMKYVKATRDNLREVKRLLRSFLKKELGY